MLSRGNAKLESRWCWKSTGKGKGEGEGEEEREGELLDAIQDKMAG